MKKIKTKQDNIKFNEKENSIEIYGISMHGIYNVYYSNTHFQLNCDSLTPHIIK